MTTPKTQVHSCRVLTSQANSNGTTTVTVRATVPTEGEIVGLMMSESKSATVAAKSETAETSPPASKGSNTHEARAYTKAAQLYAQAADAFADPKNKKRTPNDLRIAASLYEDSARAHGRAALVRRHADPDTDTVPLDPHLLRVLYTY